MYIPPVLNKKLGDSFCEMFEGLGCSILITSESKEFLERIAIEFTSDNSVPYGGAEYGIHVFLDPSRTPDHRYGVVCSQWMGIHNSISHTLPKFKKYLDKRIRRILFPKIGIRVYDCNIRRIEYDYSRIKEELAENFPENGYYIPEHLIELLKKKRSSEVVDEFDSYFYLGDFADGLEKITEEYGRNMLQIPMMGGFFEIETSLKIRKGFMGANLFVYLKRSRNLYRLEKDITGCLLNLPCICQIGGLLASGSKIGRYCAPSPKKFNNLFPITTNTPFLTHLIEPSSIIEKIKGCKKESLDLDEIEDFLRKSSQAVPEGTGHIAEIVLNSFSLTELKVGFVILLQHLAFKEDVLHIHAGAYQKRLGNIVISLKELFYPARA